MKMSEPSRTKIIRATGQDLPVIAKLADVIWRACYSDIISPAQIEYMLAQMYALDTMGREIHSQGIRYNLLLANDKAVGFASYGPAPEPDVMKLHKLYVLPEWHGRGLGSLLLRHVELQVRAGGAHSLLLSVNKRNTRAINAYKRNGFAIADSVITDIGGGFIMDDYVMVKEFTINPAGEGVL